MSGFVGRVATLTLVLAVCVYLLLGLHVVLAKNPVIIPVWEGEKAQAVAFSGDEKYVFVWRSAYGWVYSSEDGLNYILVVDHYTSTTPYLYIYEVETGEQIAKVSGVGFYVFDGKSITKLWTHSALENSMRGYVFHDKVVVVTTGGTLYIFDYGGNVIKQIDLPIDHVDSGFAVTSDGQYVAIGPGSKATFPAPVVLVDLTTYTLTNITFVDSRVLRLAIDKARKFVVIGENDGDLTIVSFSGEVLWNKTHSSGIASMAYNSKLKLLAYGDRDGHMYVYNVTDPRNPELITSYYDADAGYEHGVYAPTSLSDSGIGGMDELGRVIVFHNPYNGYTWFVHVPTKTWYKYKGGTVQVICYAYPASISPSGKYVYAGQTLFIIIYQDPQSGKARVVFDVELTSPLTEIVSVSKPLTFKPKTRNFHTYIFNVELLIRKVLFGGAKKVQYGNVSNPAVAYSSNLLSWGELVSVGFGLCPGSKFTVREDLTFTSSDNVTVVGDIYISSGVLIGGSKLTIPLRKPIPVGDVEGLVIVFDEFKLGEFIVGDVNFNPYWLTLLLGSMWGGLSTSAIAGIISVPKVVKGGLIIAGIGAILGASIVFAGYTTYVAPITLNLIVIDDGYGNLYGTAYVLTSRETYSNILYNYDKEIRNQLASKLGLKGVYFQYIYDIADTDEELLRKFRSGEARRRILQLNYKDLITFTALKFNIDLDKAKVVKVITFFGFLTYVEFGCALHAVYRPIKFSWAFKNAKVLALHVGTTFASGSEVYRYVPYIYVNGKKVDCLETPRGSLCRVAFPEGVDSVTIQFPTELLPENSLVEISLSMIVRVKRDCSCTNTTCVCSLHYDWENTLMKIRTITLIDMPKPAVIIERVFRYRYGEFKNIVFINETYLQQLEPLLKDTKEFDMWRRVGNMFELNSTYTINGEKKYTYTTIKNTLWLDPANGGILQPCKNYTFIYYMAIPHDVGVKIYFNGTKKVATQPTHITFKVVSNVEQDVWVRYSIQLWRFNYEKMSFDVVNLHSNIEKVHVIDETLIIIDASPYIQVAVSEIRRGYPSLIWVIVDVVNASVGNYFKSNDHDEKPLPILTTLPIVNTTELTVYVYDVINLEAIPNALVKVFNYTSSGYLELVCEGYTNSLGLFKCNLTTGLTYIVDVWHENYTDINYVVLANGSKIEGRAIYLTKFNNYVVYPMIPSNLSAQFITPKGNWTHAPHPIILPNGTVYQVLAVQVVYEDGAPFLGALVEIYDANTQNLLATGRTNGTGFAFFYIKNGSIVNIHVVAKVNNVTYEWWRNNTVIDKSLWLVFTIPKKSPLYEPEVAIIDLRLEVHRAQSWFMGNVSHLYIITLWTNTPQEVTIRFELWVVNSSSGEPITLVNTWNKTYSLELGMNVFWNWLKISKPETYRLYAKIVAYQNDTNTKNNELWSNWVTFKGFLDITPIIVVEPIKQKIPYFLLPEDVVKIAIGIRVKTNAKYVPMWFKVDVIGVAKWGVKKLLHVEKSEKAIGSVNGSIVEFTIWRNITITIPWTHKLNITILTSSPIEDFIENNNKSYVIDIDPNIKLVKIEVPKVVVEKSKVTLKVYTRSNLPNATTTYITAYWRGIGGVFEEKIEIGKTENETFTLTISAPENTIIYSVPPIKIKQPIENRTLVVTISGGDVYAEDNSYEEDVSVMSSGLYFTSTWLITILTIIVATLLAILIVKLVVRRSKHTVMERGMKKYWELRAI